MLYKILELAIFGCFAFIWCLPWIRRRLLTLSSIFSFVWGGIAFSSITWVQIPLQKVYSEALLGTAVPNFLRALGFAGISGFVQEFFKAIGPIIGLIVLRDRLKFKPIVLGVTVGAGFGLVEASVLNWDALLSFWGIFERFSAICFHVGASGLVLYGFQQRKALLFYAIAALAHGFLNFLIWVFRRGYFSVALLEVLAFIYALVLFFIVLILSYRREEACSV